MSTVTDPARALNPHARGRGRQQRRALASLAGWLLSGLAFLLLAFALLDILRLVFVRGFAALNLQLFMTPTSGIAGGLLNA
ncbi:MAG: hypothetical protein ACYCZI_13185, partial [Metallibacterium scheffleri]